MSWGDWIRTSDLLLPKEGNTLTNYYILPDFRGKRASVPEFPDINAVLCRAKLNPKLNPHHARCAADPARSMQHFRLPNRTE